MNRTAAQGNLVSDVKSKFRLPLSPQVLEMGRTSPLKNFDPDKESFLDNSVYKLFKFCCCEGFGFGAVDVFYVILT